MINKENFELFAIDFIDGNLDTETRSEMIAFLERNPDIKNEIEELSNPIILEADNAITFNNKASLKKEKKTNSNDISDQNDNIATVEIEIEELNTEPTITKKDTPEIIAPPTVLEPNKTEIAKIITTPAPKNQINTINKNQADESTKIKNQYVKKDNG